MQQWYLILKGGELEAPTNRVCSLCVLSLTGRNRRLKEKMEEEKEKKVAAPDLEEGGGGAASIRQPWKDKILGMRYNS